MEEEEKRRNVEKKGEGGSEGSQEGRRHLVQHERHRMDEQNRGFTGGRRIQALGGSWVRGGETAGTGKDGKNQDKRAGVGR